jgi:hypothetical protein
MCSQSQFCLVVVACQHHHPISLFANNNKNNNNECEFQQKSTPVTVLCVDQF